MFRKGDAVESMCKACPKSLQPKSILALLLPWSVGKSSLMVPGLCCFSPLGWFRFCPSAVNSLQILTLWSLWQAPQSWVCPMAWRTWTSALWWGTFPTWHSCWALHGWFFSYKWGGTCRISVSAVLNEEWRLEGIPVGYLLSLTDLEYYKNITYSIMSTVIYKQDPCCSNRLSFRYAVTEAPRLAAVCPLPRCPDQL